ncbi:sensor histidine kinase [Streptomyces albiaxialis]|uniref:sensor histidine kinase n=1 Tax=Streptomyces albiaxialis TaxID=329523 RepID=UPI0031D0829F
MAHSRRWRELAVRPLRRSELLGLDCLAAAELLVLYLSVPFSTPRADEVPLPVRLLLVAAMALPLAVRRLWPVPVLAVVTVASFAGAVSGVVAEPLLAISFALYSVAVVSGRTRWVPTRAIAVASVLVLISTFVLGPRMDLRPAVVHVLGVVLAGAAWTTGRAVRERQAYVERSARQLAASAVTEERLRIARELHDVVAHHIGVIAVKAGVANHVLAARPEEAGEALTAIEASSRTALAEMRQMLGVLRATGAGEGRGSPGGEPSAALGPVPDLSALPTLIEHAATAGVTVELAGGPHHQLPEAVSLSAYRIVQEAVTNVMKHAAPARCRVDLDTDGEELRIDVTDDGPGRPREPQKALAGRAVHEEVTTGHGLVGMRERVALHGGEFEAGPGESGGFAVRARIPFTSRTRGHP